MDSADRDRIDEARQELHRIISDREMRNALLLVFANKQDLPGGISSLPLPLTASSQFPALNLTNRVKAMSPAEVTEKLQLHKLKDHLWFVHPSCATTAEGLFEGLVLHNLLSFPSVAYFLFFCRHGYRKMQSQIENNVICSRIDGWVGVQFVANGGGNMSGYP